jgi:hypothetical protein
LPLNEDVVLTAIKVPDALPLKVLDPTIKSAVDVVWSGEPLTASPPVAVALVKKRLGKRPYPVADMFVEETFVRDDDPTERTPVELEKVKRALDVAAPPSCPKRICVSTPVEKLDVMYLFPLGSKTLEIRLPKVTVEPEARRRFTKELDTFVRSERLLAAWRYPVTTDEVTYLLPFGSNALAIRLPKVTVEPEARRRFTSDEDTFARSDKLFAVRRAPKLDV